MLGHTGPAKFKNTTAKFKPRFAQKACSFGVKMGLSFGGDQQSYTTKGY